MHHLFREVRGLVSMENKYDYTDQVGMDKGQFGLLNGQFNSIISVEENHGKMALLTMEWRRRGGSTKTYNFSGSYCSI